MTDQELHVAIDRLTKRLAELEGFDAKAMTERRPPNLVALETAITVALGRAFGENTADFKRYQGAGQLSWNPPIGPLVIGAPARPPTPLSSYQQGVESNIAKARALLSGAIQVLKEDFGERESPAVPAAGAVFTHALSKVFVVHGHDVGAREAVARFLEKIGLEAIILQEQANRGMTIIEKFELHASDVAFAVVLLTPDDIGGPTSAESQLSRARQNVVFELGYFVGKLGRGRACLLRKGQIEIPSDLYGVIYTEMDAGNGWKISLVQELKAAGLKFDTNKVWE